MSLCPCQDGLKAAIVQESHLRYGAFSKDESTTVIRNCLETQQWD